MSFTIPRFGLGTFRLQGPVVIDSVRNALELGYRAIDTAQIYGNEADVGQAIADSGLARKQLFLTTKIWVENLGADRLVPSLQDSLSKLGTDHVDLTLIHWPAPEDGVPLGESLHALVQARELGLTRQIGVSNFNIALMRQAIDILGQEMIATNQIELSPYLQNHKLVAFLEQHHIPITSYMTLAYGKVLSDPVIQKIAQHHQATPAQVALAWAMQQGYCVIPSSTQREHLASNLLSQTLQLTAHDMEQISLLERNGREVNPDGLAPHWD